MKKGGKLSFKVGDKAIYPGHGLGKITSIETKEISGTRQKFYSIFIMNSEMKVMIPENRMKAVGIRSIITRKEAEKVLEVLKDHNRKDSLVESGKNWSKRHQEYLKIIKTGNVFNTARVLRELLNIDKKKGLSFYERQLMLTVCKMLFDEISMVVKKEELQEALDFFSILSQLKH